MLKQYRPMTAGQRHLILTTHDELTRVEGKRATLGGEKKLLQRKRRTNGRNHHGHITCRHRAGISVFIVLSTLKEIRKRSQRL